jgi:pyruvate,water dikinase
LFHYSLNSTHAQAYQKESNTPDDTLAMGVIVQKLICSDISGVCFTANPVSGNKNEMIIEACHGLGELLVQGKITPENYVINGSDAHVVSHTKANQTAMLTITNGQLHEIPVLKEKMQGNILSESQCNKIVSTAKVIEDHFGTPQDIEWAIEKGSLYIVQSRPITTLS